MKREFTGDSRTQGFAGTLILTASHSVIHPCMDDPTALGATIPVAYQMGFRLRPHPWWQCTYDVRIIFRILDPLPPLVCYDMIFTYPLPLLDIIFILATPLSSEITPSVKNKI